jgi:hypothetical protein
MGIFGDDFPDEPTPEMVEGKAVPRGLENEQAQLGTPGKITIQTQNSDVEKQKDLIREEEDALHRDGLAIMRGALRFADVSLDDFGPSREWIEEYGEDDAKRMFRCAQMALGTSKSAPVGLALAQRMVVGISAARAKERAKSKEHRTLNVYILPQPVVGQRKVLDVEGE